MSQAFLRDNGLKLIVRSHEGPDARFKRSGDDKMPSIDEGFSIDHDTPSTAGLGALVDTHHMQLAVCAPAARVAGSRRLLCVCCGTACSMVPSL